MHGVAARSRGSYSYTIPYWSYRPFTADVVHIYSCIECVSHHFWCPLMVCHKCSDICRYYYAHCMYALMCVLYTYSGWLNISGYTHIYIVSADQHTIDDVTLWHVSASYHEHCIIINSVFLLYHQSILCSGTMHCKNPLFTLLWNSPLSRYSCEPNGRWGCFSTLLVQ